MDLTFFGRIRKNTAKEISKLFKVKCRLSLFTVFDLYVYWERAGCCGTAEEVLFLCLKN